LCWQVKFTYNSDVFLSQVRK